MEKRTFLTCPGRAASPGRDTLTLASPAALDSAAPSLHKNPTHFFATGTDR